MRYTRILLLLGLAACLVFASSASAGSSENYRIDWMVPLSSSGGGPASSAHYTVNYTIGQSVVGAGSSESFASTLGFWYQQIHDWLIMLPEIFRNNP